MNFLDSRYFISFLRLLKLTALKFLRQNIDLGKNVKIDWSTNIYNNGNKVILGDGVYLRSIRKKYQASMYFPATILIDVKGASVEIGKGSRINGSYIHAQKRISIGDNCVIASGVNIMDTNGHEL